MSDCAVCCEKINKSNRKEVNCGYCNFLICRTCFQRYIMESVEDPHCMNCKKEFNRDFLTDVCTSVFLTTQFKEHRQNVLLDREKGLLIETQPYVLVEKEKENMRKQIDSVHLELHELEAKRREKLARIGDLNYQISILNVNNSNETVEARKFIRKCPINDCRGFLSSRWKCGSCESFICNKCNELKEDGHECDPANVASMELLNKDTKPCPECATMIYKIAGCSQMWCVNCNTPWDWNSGKKD